MSKQKIRFIIGLIVLAVVFLIGFQVFWLRGAYSEYGDRFDRSVRQALTNTVEGTMEKSFLQRAYRMSTLSFRSDTLTQEFFQRLGKDSIKQRQSFSIDVRSDNVIAGRTGDERFMDTHDPDSVTVMVFSSEWEDEGDSGHHLIEEVISFDSLERMPMGGPQSPHEMFNAVFRDNPEKDQVYGVVDSILAVELNEEELDIPYNLGIIDMRKDSFLFLTGPSPEQEALRGDDSYQALLVQTGLGSPLRIRVTFPERGNFLWSQLLAVLIGSFLLVVIVVGCMVYALATIIRQKKLSEIKNDFVNNMTHELKTPIANISLAVESLLNFNVRENEERTLRYLNIARDENARLGGMVEKVLRTATFDGEGLKLKMVEVDLHAVINKVMEACKLQVEDKGGHISAELGANTAEVRGDAAHLAGVIYNLVDNANKYSPQSPDIHIKTATRNGQLVVSVKDRGMGIAAQHLKRIFDRFYRVPTGNVHNVKGFGFGLSYVQEVVNRHGGRIDVSSEVGRGSEFEIRLPYVS